MKGHGTGNDDGLEGFMDATLLSSRFALLIRYALNHERRNDPRLLDR